MGFKHGKIVSTLTLYLTETLNWYVCSVLECRSFCFFFGLEQEIFVTVGSISLKSLL